MPEFTREYAGAKLVPVKELEKALAEIDRLKGKLEQKMGTIDTLRERVRELEDRLMTRKA